MPTNAELFFAKVEAIKAAVAAVITPVAPLAKIVTRFTFDVGPDNWAALLRSDSDLDVNGDPRVHMIQIYYRAIEQADDAPIGSLDPILTLGVDFFHGYDFGTDADNSELRLMGEVAKAKWALASSTDLGMNEVANTHPGYASVMGHEGLTIPNFNLNNNLFGAQPVQYALGRLVVRMQSQYVRGQ